MERLDRYLVTTGAVSGRDKAKQLIENGCVTINGKTVHKVSLLVSDTDTVVCDTSSIRYVGRGGLKLEHALSMAPIPLAGAICLDVGASTGGFTDCMLQNGAKRVFAVDVGHGQLHPHLAADARVVNIEGCDIRRTDVLTRALQGEVITVCSVDVSFISLKLVIPAILPLLSDGATLIVLIKPQFEVGKQHVGKGGIVKDERVRLEIVENLKAFFAMQNLHLQALAPSPITGGDGNVEFLAVLCYNQHEE